MAPDNRLGQSSVVTLPLGVGETAVIDEWLVREGAVVAEQKVLLRYTCSGVKRDLQATSSGMVGKIGKKAGEQVNNAEVVCRINPCPHHESFNGICTTCGMETGDSDDETVGPRPPRREDGFGESMQAGAKRKSFGLFGGVVNSKLKRSKQGVAVQQQERVQELIASKRLALVLDLDHTLLHTSNAQNEKQRQVMLRVEGLSKDVKQIWCKGTGYFTKLRPHVRTFLEKLSHLYELYIYTAGDRDYAEVVASVLDEHKRYFPGRIISRDDYSDVAKEEKKLDKVFPVAEHWKMVLILDDNNETWDDPQEDGRNSVNNLIHADKYSFWPRHLGETHNPVVLGAKMHAHTEHGQHVLQSSPPLTSPHHTEKQRHTVQVPHPPITSGEPAPAHVAASFGASSADDAALLGQEAGKTEEEVGGKEEKDDSAEWVDQTEAAQDECNGGGSGDEAEEGGMLEEMKALLAADSTDEYLKTLTEVLTDLHTNFYAEIGRRPQGSKGHAANAKDACDVRELLARRQAQVLAGVKVAFSGVFKHPADYLRALRQHQKHTAVLGKGSGGHVTQLWRSVQEAAVAVSLGAECCLDVSDCTHLVTVMRSEEGYTDKLLDSLAPPPPGKAPVQVIRPDWLYVSKALWKRADEEQFRLHGWEEIKEKAVAAVAERVRRINKESNVPCKRPRDCQEDTDAGSVANGNALCSSSSFAHVCSSSVHALTPRSEKTLISDAQALLDNLDNILAGGGTGRGTGGCSSSAKDVDGLPVSAGVVDSETAVSPTPRTAVSVAIPRVAECLGYSAHTFLDEAVGQMRRADSGYNGGDDMESDSESGVEFLEKEDDDEDIDDILLAEMDEDGDEDDLDQF